MLTYAAVSYVTIENNVDNAVQYIRNLVLTSDGSENGTTGIVLDGDQVLIEAGQVKANSITIDNGSSNVAVLSMS